MKNRVRTALVIIACLVGLTGCVKLDGDLKVNSDETVSGSMKIGLDKQLASSSGQSLDLLRQSVEKGLQQTSTEGVTCKSFEDDKYVGSNCTFDNVPFRSMGQSTDDGVGFRKEGDKFFVSIKDLGLDGDTNGITPVVDFKITMPGKILEHDAGAKVDGRTATYDSLDKLGKVSLTSEAGSSFPAWALILIIVLLLLGGGAVAFFVLRGRKAKTQQYGQYGQYPGQPQGQWGSQYGGQPGAPGQYGPPQGQPGGYGQPGQPGPYGAGPQGPYGQPPQQYGQPGPGQYPGQPQPPQQGQPGQWGPQQPPQGPPQQGQGGWGQPPQGPPAQGQPPQGQPQQGQPQQGRPPQGQPPQGQPPQQGQGGWGQPPQGGQQGGWNRPPDNDGQ
ncbi:LppM family (lipo)protein [Kribbella sp. NPDC051620]|uniref:LppM family (lipo)protein n=1 Tax=Kribbella sp. NPDC051620 TaxID=3364120 RepID=UPI0037B79A29